MGHERGSATLEAAIVYPAVLTLVLVAVNAALWFHARNVALAAAQEGARAARAYGSSPAAGQRTAERFAREVGGSFLNAPSVSVGRRGDSVVVTVRGEALTLVPLLRLGVSQVARSPIERFTTDG